MPCKHKFLNHPNHLANHQGLLPNWQVETLIIGTFNPEDVWVPNNNAQYFYGRSKYFWDILPEFADMLPMHHNDIAAQFDFLIANHIGLTDLLIEIEDADLDNQQHVARISSYQDNQIELFENLVWNTPFITDYIYDQGIKSVYFTRLGGGGKFGGQMALIENFCLQNGVYCNRLFTPSGQGLGQGVPRRNRLIHKWFNENGANQFRFLSPNFEVLNFPWE